MKSLCRQNNYPLSPAHCLLAYGFVIAILSLTLTKLHILNILRLTLYDGRIDKKGLRLGLLFRRHLKDSLSFGQFKISSLPSQITDKSFLNFTALKSFDRQFGD